MIAVEYAVPNDADLEIVAAHMRQADREECEASMAMGPLEALRKSVALSHEAVVARVGGEPVCIYGLGFGSITSGLARPWLLGTHAVEWHCLTFLRANRRIVREWSSRYDLENYVDARHTMSIRWLRWLGFKLDAPEPFGPFGYQFHRFEMKKGAV